MRRTGRFADCAAMCLALVAAAYMTVRRPGSGVNDLLPGGRWYAAIGIAVALLVVAGLWLAARRGTIARVATRTLLYSVALVLGWVAVSRARTISWENAGLVPTSWPPRAESSHATRLQTLTPAERASWAVHVAAHWLVDSMSTGDSLTIPAAWPFPSDIELTMRRVGSVRVEIWSRAPDGTVACLAIPSGLLPDVTAAQQDACVKARVAPPDLGFRMPRRVVVAPPSPPSSSPGLAWPQHRLDPDKSATLAVDGATAASWRQQLDGPVRSAPSVAGGLVLIGTHGTGDLEALDLETGRRRWSARLPNWIHQDVVSDGRIAVLGFGSVWASFAGREPTGVAAYALQSGRHLWTAFDESSVMTSPVVIDSTVIYVSAAGILRKRALNTGALLAQRRLPGGVIMGPPAFRGDTIVVGLDPNSVCALLASSLATLWCRKFPGHRLMGHTAPAIGDGSVIVSSAGLLRSLSWTDFRHMPRTLQGRILFTALGPGEFSTSQSFESLDLRDGHVRWKSRAFGATRDVDGHISGTASIRGDLAVIVLPISDSVIAFRPASGRILWTAPAHKSRGAPLLLGDRAVISGADGVIEVRNLVTGDTVCTLHRPVGYDRAGPALAGNLVILANLKGMVEAIPQDNLLRCQDSAAQAIAAAH